jgi:hypothetical protein
MEHIAGMTHRLDRLDQAWAPSAKVKRLKFGIQKTISPAAGGCLTEELPTRNASRRVRLSMTDVDKVVVGTQCAWHQTSSRRAVVGSAD